MASLKKEREINLNNLFLLCSLFLIPIAVAYFAIKNIIDENYYYDIQEIKNKLTSQSEKINKISKDRYQINDFLKTIVVNNKIFKHSEEEIKNFFERIEKKYPEAFRWRVCDGNGNMLKINSKTMIPGNKTWEKITKNFTANINYLSKKNDVIVGYEMNTELFKALSNIQKLVGNSFKVEHLNTALNQAIDFKWYGNACYAIWTVEGKEYKDGYPETINGGIILLVFPGKLPPTIWITRMIKQRKKGNNKLEYPIILMNLTNDYSEYVDEDLPKSTEFSSDLIDTYKNRAKKIFNFRDYMCSCSEYNQNSDYRIISMANIKDINSVHSLKILRLNIIVLFLSVSIIYLIFFTDKIRFSNFSLRKRISVIFILSIFMPIITLVSIGNSFIKHEKTRLKETAYTKMREGVEALDIRYKDTPRLFESKLFETISNLLGKAPYSKEHVQKQMQQAINDKVIREFYLTNDNGKIIYSSFSNIDQTAKKMLEYVCKKSLELQLNMKKVSSNKASEFIEEELSEMFEVFKNDMEFSRPTHLRHFVYLDRHLYVMNTHIVIENKECCLLLVLPEHILENVFAKNEFTENKLTKSSEIDYDENKLELSFFSTLHGETSYPEESPLWDKITSELDLALSLSSEEKGEITINNENFLYYLKPLASMEEKSLIPCYLTSMKPIERRTRDLTIIFVSISFIAILGTSILGLSLSSSLLEPIKTIDTAAQLVGKGDLNVSVPDIGNDELGNLGKTFNEMLKGLREHQKMQVYVSDSVKEAIQENDKESESLHNGKNMEATILFSDIRNFTGITEKNEPNTVFNLLNEFLGGVEPIIRMNHGRVDKYIGDAVMAVFHKELPEHHAVSAVKTAVMMMKFIEKMNRERQEKGLFPIAIGIGISTGTVLLGDVGSSERKDLTVIGDEVNLASRLESASKQGKYSKIIFSGSTYNVVKDIVEVELMPFNEIRGKEQNVSIYELIKFKG